MARDNLVVSRHPVGMVRLKIDGPGARIVIDTGENCTAIPVACWQTLEEIETQATGSDARLVLMTSADSLSFLRRSGARNG